MSCSCIIPAHNEEARIGYVLNQLIQLENLSQIVVVDDGSNDSTSDQVKKLPQITLIKKPKRQGKTAAIRTGVQCVNYSNLLLFDADLTYFNLNQLDQAILYFQKDSSLDSLLLRAQYVKMKLARADVLQSGTRLIRKQLLNKILHQKISGYQLEFAINEYIYKNDLNSAWTWFESKQPTKFSKQKSLLAFVDEIKMNQEIYNYQGFPRYLQVLLTFWPPQLKNQQFVGSSRT